MLNRRLIQRHIFNISDLSTDVPMGWGTIISVSTAPSNPGQILISYETDPTDRWPRRVFIFRDGVFVPDAVEHVGSVTMEDGTNLHVYLQVRG
ncbi:hypothetical protein SEA_ALAINAMARIE_76 [Gordonia phage AlainaMarie]|nr:hypothetical protein SEA_ALAINAMARIE_76 [Gordonia phage AlainaMarie]